MRAFVYDWEAAEREEKLMISRNPNLKGQSRGEMGLKEFTSTKIRSNIAGLDVAISIDHIAQLCGLRQIGKKLREFQEDENYK
jgi:hypothetical protein